MEHKKVVPPISKIYPAFIFFALFLLYFLFRARTLGYGDSVVFLFSITKGFDLHTNATNHFLYVNAMCLFAKIVPVGSFFQKSVFFSIIFSLATLLQLYRIGLIFTKNINASLAAVVVIGLSFTYWRQTEIIETYTFNNFIFASFLFYVIKDLYFNQDKNTLWASFFYGLSLLAHIQNILLLPFYLFYLWLILQHNYKKVFLCILIVFSLFSVLLWIPLLWKTNSLTSVFFDSDSFKGKVVAFDFFSLIKGFVKSLGYFFYNFLFFSLFILHGFFLVFRESKKIFFLLGLAILPFWAFACRYDVPDNYVFFLQPYLIMALASTYSFDYWMKQYSFSKYLIPLQLFLFPFSYFLIWQISLKIPSFEPINKAKSYKGGLKYLLWPGMNNEADLLQLSKEFYHGKQKPDTFHEFEWNYDAAIEYMKYTGELDSQNQKQN